MVIDLPAAGGDAVISEAPDAAGLRLADFARDHGLALVRFAYLLCGDRALADDLVQDCYVSLFRGFGERMSVESPVAYARRAIVNGFVSSTRRQRAVLTTSGEVPDRRVDDVPNEQGALWQSLARLPRRQRAVLVMRYYLDLPDETVAGLLGCRSGTVRSLAARGFAALRVDPGLATALADGEEWR